MKKMPIFVCCLVLLSACSSNSNNTEEIIVVNQPNPNDEQTNEQTNENSLYIKDKDE